MNAIREVAAKLKSEDILVISGDFNLSNLEWFTDEKEDCDIAIPLNASLEKETTVLDSMHEMGLVQVNKIGNKNGAMLDLVWTNCTETVSCSKNTHHLLKKESHHCAYELKVSDIESIQSNSISNFSYRDFTNANYEAINEKLNDIDWSNIFSGDVLDSHISKFYELIDSVISSNVELKTKKISSHPKWNGDLPNGMVFGDKKSGNNREIAQFFATHFAKALTKPDSSIIDDNSGDEPFLKDLCANFPTIDITEELVLDAINNLPNNMVSGPDEIPNVFLKKCLPALLKPITYMLKESLETGFVPEIWKKSFVRPVHKSGLRTNVENYRGVALQCIIPKLLDSIVAKHLNYNMINIIDDSQHGFMKGRSTITNLAEFTSCAILGMENHIQTDAIYLDIAKAFDSVNVDLLINKLAIMGLNEQLLKWIKSYLHGRQQIVKLNNDMSSPIDVTSGTGQGYPI
ncbi:uncharacterized protein LOC129572189, partial [Sitodiplosis mosellana]|uniref:uncharacterized protein LOC129572189 n=1 Tax=Sitodiplosis mosellana TaxID=263140 RepID=UPI0024447BC2